MKTLITIIVLLLSIGMFGQDKITCFDCKVMTIGKYEIDTENIPLNKRYVMYNKIYKGIKNGYILVDVLAFKGDDKIKVLICKGNKYKLIKI